MRHRSVCLPTCQQLSAFVIKGCRSFEGVVSPSPKTKSNIVQNILTFPSRNQYIAPLKQPPVGRNLNSNPSVSICVRAGSFVLPSSLASPVFGTSAPGTEAAPESPEGHPAVLSTCIWLRTQRNIDKLSQMAQNIEPCRHAEIRLT